MSMIGKDHENIYITLSLSVEHIQLLSFLFFEGGSLAKVENFFFVYRDVEIDSYGFKLVATEFLDLKEMCFSLKYKKTFHSN